MKRNALLYLAIALIALLCSAPAIAQEVTEQDILEAQAAFDLGAEMFIQENYGRAIVEFRKAHEIHPHPVFLHNIALANKRLNRIERALESALQAQDMDQELPAGTADRNSGIIVGARTVLEAREIATAIGRTLPQAADTVDPSITPPETSTGLGALGYAGIGTAGVGLIGLGVAAVYDRRILNGMEEARGMPAGADREERIDELEAMQTTGQIFLFAGAGLTVVGATLLMIDLVGGSSDRPVAVGPSLDRPGVVVQGRF